LFDEECLDFLDQKKQAKMQWVQDTSQSYVGNPNNEDVKLADISGTTRWKLKLRNFKLPER
jgi:hypothetical protein